MWCVRFCFGMALGPLTFNNMTFCVAVKPDDCIRTKYKPVGSARPSSGMV